MQCYQELFTKRYGITYAYVLRHPGYTALRQLLVLSSGYTAQHFSLSELILPDFRDLPVAFSALSGLVQNESKNKKNKIKVIVGLFRLP